MRDVHYLFHNWSIVVTIYVPYLPTYCYIINTVWSKWRILVLFIESTTSRHETPEHFKGIKASQSVHHFAGSCIASNIVCVFSPCDVRFLSFPFARRYVCNLVYVKKNLNEASSIARHKRVTAYSLYCKYVQSHITYMCG